MRPPLEFALLRDDLPYDFADRLGELAQRGGSAAVLDFFRERANLRNRLIYASTDGVPRVEREASFVAGSRLNVFSILATTIMIAPWRQHQSFALQCLSAFLRAVGEAEEDAEAAGALTN